MSDNNSKANVSVGKPKIGGAIWTAPAGTTVPTTAVAELDAAFKCLGYVSSDGVKNANSKETTEIKAWGKETVLVPVTNHTDKFDMTFIEALNSYVLKAAHGDGNVSGDINTGLAVTVDGSDAESHVYVIDMELNGSVKKRIVIPDGVVTEVGEIVYKDDTVIGYPITITALPDSSENTHYEYLKKATST